MKIGICCIVKQENLYLRDWVNYYYNMGVDRIILYDNNDVNGEYPQQVIGDYIASGFVVYKDVRGLYRYQIEAYNQCYNEYIDEFDWIGFLDIDEYWYLAPHLTFDDFFSEERFPNAIGLFLNWLCYGDNDLIHYDSRPVYERFTKPTLPIETEHNAVKKCFVRCVRGANVEFIDANAFSFNNVNGKVYTVDGAELKNEFKIVYEDSFVKHYRTLTIEEFLYRRFGRGGYADLGSAFKKDTILNVFTSQNEITEEKQKIIDKFFENFNIVEDVPDTCIYF